MELFGLRLKGLRLSKNLTQKQLAGRLGIGNASISGYEMGTIYPSVDVLVQIAKYFDTSTDYLLGLSDTPNVALSHLTDEQVVLIMNLICQFERLNRE